MVLHRPPSEHQFEDLRLSQFSNYMRIWSLFAFRRWLCSPFSAVSLLAVVAVAAFKSPTALQLENVALRHQLCVLYRSVKKPKLTVPDRLLWAWLCGVWGNWRSAPIIVKPETVITWHRRGFRLLWRWKIRHGQRGRPGVSKDVRQLIRTMSRENPLWGAPRIHGELLKLGIDIGQTSVGKYMVRLRQPPSQTWRTFLSGPACSCGKPSRLTNFHVTYCVIAMAFSASKFTRQVKALGIDEGETGTSHCHSASWRAASPIRTARRLKFCTGSTALRQGSMCPDARSLEIRAGTSRYRHTKPEAWPIQQPLGGDVTLREVTIGPRPPKHPTGYEISDNHDGAKTVIEVVAAFFR